MLEVKMSDIFQSSELKVPLYQDFMPIVMSYVENTARVFKLNEEEVSSLILATEEIFSFLVFNARRADDMTLIARFKGSYIEIIAKFAAEMLPVQSLNLTTKISAEDSDALEYMGLLIAARSVDSLDLNIDDDGNMSLCMTKKKRYNQVKVLPFNGVEYVGRYQAIDIDVDRIEEFCAIASSKYYNRANAEFFRYPQQLADMIARGDYDGCFVVDEEEHLAGALFWEASGEMIFGYGFFIFAESDRDEVANLLMEGCLRRTLMFKPHCMFINHSTSETPMDFLRVGHEAAYRAMYASSMLANVYLNSALVDFVKGYYHKLNLVRNVYEHMSSEANSNDLSPYSAFAATMDKVTREVTLSTLWVGRDAVSNLQNHISVLSKEGFSRIVFDLAIGKPEQAIMGGFLLEAGFKPEMIIPWTKEGDILRFCFETTDASMQQTD